MGYNASKLLHGEKLEISWRKGKASRGLDAEDVLEEEEEPEVNAFEAVRRRRNKGKEKGRGSHAPTRALDAIDDDDDDEVVHVSTLRRESAVIEITSTPELLSRRQKDELNDWLLTFRKRWNNWWNYLVSCSKPSQRLR